MALQTIFIFCGKILTCQELKKTVHILYQIVVKMREGKIWQVVSLSDHLVLYISRATCLKRGTDAVPQYVFRFGVDCEVGIGQLGFVTSV